METSVAVVFIVLLNTGNACIFNVFIALINPTTSTFVTDDYTLCTMSCKTFCKEELLLEGEINLFIQEVKAVATEKK